MAVIKGYIKAKTNILDSHDLARLDKTLGYSAELYEFMDYEGANLWSSFESIATANDGAMVGNTFMLSIAKDAGVINYGDEVVISGIHAQAQFSTKKEARQAYNQARKLVPAFNRATSGDVKVQNAEAQIYGNGIVEIRFDLRITLPIL